MAKGIIDEIKLCETEATEIINTAHLKAEEIIDNANLKAKDKREALISEAKTKGNSIVATAENNAFKVKNKAFEKNSAEADEIKSEASKNIDKAIDLIINEIIPE